MALSGSGCLCVSPYLCVQNIQDYWFPPAWKVFWLVSTDSESMAALASALVPADKVSCRHTLRHTPRRTFRHRAVQGEEFLHGWYL